jgi:hypothetical protein
MLVRCFYPEDIRRWWPDYLSSGPKSRAIFDGATEFIVGHFTSSKFLPEILEHGLIPDFHKERAVDDNLPSDNQSVYLLTNYDRYYLERAVKYNGNEAISIEVQVPHLRLRADEGQLSPQTLSTVDQEEALYLSMCRGACKHLGPISPPCILSIHASNGRLLYKA